MYNFKSKLLILSVFLWIHGHILYEALLRAFDSRYRSEIRLRRTDELGSGCCTDGYQRLRTFMMHRLLAE